MAAVTESSTANLFLDFSRRKQLEQDCPRLRGYVQSLTDEQGRWCPNGSNNSVGNFVLLDDNVQQWL